MNKYCTPILVAAALAVLVQEAALIAADNARDAKSLCGRIFGGAAGRAATKGVAVAGVIHGE